MSAKIDYCPLKTNDYQIKPQFSMSKWLFYEDKVFSFSALSALRHFFRRFFIEVIRQFLFADRRSKFSYLAFCALRDPFFQWMAAKAIIIILYGDGTIFSHPF